MSEVRRLGSQQSSYNVGLTCLTDPRLLDFQTAMSKVREHGSQLGPCNMGLTYLADPRRLDLVDNQV
jgi:hypothetical protein